MTPVVVATEKSRSFFGFGTKPPNVKLTQVTHDLFVSEVFLNYFRRGLDMATHWIGEDRLPREWPVSERPDGLLVDEDGKCLRAVEYGGDYSIDRLVSLHAAFTSVPVPYELW